LGKRSGVLGAVTDHLEIWTKSGTGQLARRLDNVQVQQKDLTQRRDRLDELFNVNYERYLLQFSQLQTVLGQMNQTSGLFGQLGAA
ncbi:flagellar filament capping protein FliD, partial [Hydrogenophaga sp. 70-12]